MKILYCVLLGIFLLSTTKVSAQTAIKGVVHTQAGESLPGVAVTDKGTANGTITDLDGSYSIIANSSDPVLIFSFLGYERIEMPVNGRSVIDITLQEEISDLQEMVVVGYGSQKRVNLSGAVDQVDGEVLKNRPISNAAQGLQGLIPNLNIQFNSGAPGEGADINIRGFTSINGGEPLILIDGVPSGSMDLNRIAPQDIASVSVIKDASAAAIYGARASFGVVLITTKEGSQAGIRISYSNNLTWNKPTVIPDKITDPYVFSRLLELSTDNTPWDNVNYDDQFYLYAKQRSEDPSLPGVRVNPNNPELWEYMGDRDWTRYFLEDMNFTHNHDFSISGMSENSAINYYLSAGYNRQNSPLALADDYFDRYSFRSKVNFKVNKWLTLGNNSFVTSTSRKTPTQFDLFNTFNFFPTDFDVNPDGSWANTSVGRSAAAIVEGGETTNKFLTIQSRFTAEASFFDQLLKINTDYTVQRNSENYNYYTTSYPIGYGPEDIREEGENYAYRNAGFSYYNVFNLYGTLSKEWGQHAFTAIVGFNQEDFRNEFFSASKQGLISSSFPTIGLATGLSTTTETIDTYALRGAFYRVNYILKEKYIVEFNGRYDGSSRFPKDQRFGFFPSGSVAWRVDQESFMSSLSSVSNFKLRGSYGSLGNQNVSNYGYISSMGTYQPGYLIDDQRPFAVSTPGLVSQNYTWEKVNTVNFGIDLGLFEDRFNFNFDMYKRNTLDMLTRGKDLPGILGATEPNENAADLETKGWELSMHYRNQLSLAGEPFNLDARVILSDSRSWITRFDNPNNSILQYYKGMELGEIWGFENDGLFESVEEIAELDQSAIIPWGALSIVPGWPKYVDQDGNKAIEKGYTLSDTKDLVLIGNSTPRIRYGLDLNMNWKGFDLRAFFQGVAKRDYYPLDYLYWGHYQQPYGGTYSHLMDFYRPENDAPADREKHSQSYLDAGLADQNLDAEFPILQGWLADRNLGTRIDQAMGLTIPQTKYMQNAAYLRLKNLTLGYSLPSLLIQKIGVSYFRIFMSAENLTEWSSIKKYFDPEAVNANIYTNPTVSPGRSGNGLNYPFQRSYSAGLNVTF